MTGFQWNGARRVPAAAKPQDQGQRTKEKGERKQKGKRSKDLVAETFIL
jgi:hypothetical protein